jgi:hypothetical protein
VLSLYVPFATLRNTLAFFRTAALAPALVAANVIWELLQTIYRNSYTCLHLYAFFLQRTILECWYLISYARYMLVFTHWHLIRRHAKIVVRMVRNSKMVVKQGKQFSILHILLLEGKAAEAWR